MPRAGATPWGRRSQRGTESNPIVVNSDGEDDNAVHPSTARQSRKKTSRANSTRMAKRVRQNNVSNPRQRADSVFDKDYDSDSDSDTDPAKLTRPYTSHDFHAGKHNSRYWPSCIPCLLVGVVDDQPDAKSEASFIKEEHRTDDPWDSYQKGLVDDEMDLDITMNHSIPNHEEDKMQVASVADDEPIIISSDDDDDDGESEENSDSEELGQRMTSSSRQGNYHSSTVEDEADEELFMMMSGALSVENPRHPSSNDHSDTSTLA